MQAERAALPDGPIRWGLVPLHPAADPSGEQPLMRHLADVLPPHGIAVLRYDRRPSRDGGDVPFSDQAEDARAAMARLRELTGEPELPVGLWGFSQGAWAAMLAAAEGVAAFLILVSASGVSPAEQMRYGAQAQLVRAGHSTRDLDDLDELRAAYEAFLRGERPRSEVQPLIDAASKRPWFELAWVQRRLPEPGSWPDMDFEPLEPLTRVRCPVLAFFGEQDEWVPVGASIERLRSAAKTAGFGLTIRTLPDTTHEPLLTASRAISPLYEEALTDWIREC